MASIDTSLTLAVPESVAAGASTDIARLHSGYTIHFVLTGTGTYQYQISADGTNWTQEGANVTSSGVLTVSKHARWGRLNCSAWTNATGTATIAGKLG
jgi:hypothetical protein